MRPIRYWYKEKADGTPWRLCRFNVEKAREEVLNEADEWEEMETFGDVLEGRATVISEAVAREMFPAGFNQEESVSS